MNEILICSSWTQIFEPCHTFILPIFMLWLCPAFCSPGIKNYSVFSAFTSRQISYNFSVFLYYTNIFSVKSSCNILGQLVQTPGQEDSYSIQFTHLQELNCNRINYTVFLYFNLYSMHLDQWHTHEKLKVVM